MKRKDDNMDKKKLLGIIIAIISVIVITAVIILFIKKYEKDFVSLQRPEPVVTVSDKASESDRQEESGALPQAEDNQFATENGKFLQ